MFLCFYSIFNAQKALRSFQSPDRVVKKLITSKTAVKRTVILENDGEFVFDFLHPPSTTSVTTGEGGHTVAANRGVFPALVGNGVAMTIGFLGPCGLNSPHTHPRATEINYIVNGTVTAGMLLENGARFVTNTVKAGQATVFPKGAIHFEQNLGCEPIIFVAAFNDEDPGVSQIAQRY
jgi:quercetin dioxygenase-like cupin family protein